MAEYRIDVWITSSESRKGFVEADSPQEAYEKFHEEVQEVDIWACTQDVGVYGDTDWEVTNLEDHNTGEKFPEHTDGGLFLAELSTRNFDFTALGRTEDEARLALQEGWRKHTEQVKASREREGLGWGEDMFTWEEIADDVNVVRIVPGQCLRDSEPLSINPF